MAKHIGIIACSAEGAALCYRTICAKAPAVMGRHAHPEITMHTHSLSEYMVHIVTGDWEKVALLMRSSLNKVVAAGAKLAICPDNTIHQAYDLVVPDSPIPWLHIAQVVGQEALTKGYRRLGVLGTRYLMEGPVYVDALLGLGMETRVPNADDRRRIDDIIFDELVYGVFKESSRQYFNEVIGKLKTQGCDAAVLGCTEIPLIVRADDAPLPTLDSTRLLAHAALRSALA
ncbi:MAG: amino acid racemase [Phycisphaerae bacterium]|nr:amino acid racemase [Phycisphaerae bacterium]